MSTNPPGRDAAQKRSAVPLAYLRQLPSWTIPVLSAVLLVAGLAIKGPVGAAALVLLLVFLGWLAYISWPKLDPAGRLLRVIILAGGLALAVWQALR
jgi:hypothetical protein